MTERVRFHRHGEGASATLFPDLGPRPFQAIFEGMVQGSPASPISPRMPLFTLYQGGARPLRDLIASIATGLYQPQPNPEDKLQREAKAKAAKAEEERSKEAYSATESSVFVAG